MTTVFARLSRIVALSAIIAFTTGVQDASPQQHAKPAILAFRPDTVFFPSLNHLDSIWVLNIGASELLIDSIKAANLYSWIAWVIAPEDTFHLLVSAYDFDENRFRHFPIKIPASDSALFIFRPPDLCPICWTNASFSPFSDSLYFFSNDSVHSPSILFAHGEGDSAVSDPQVNIAETYRLKQNYPNPFNPLTTIEFVVMKTSRVQISIHDLTGQRIRTLADAIFAPGKHAVVWNGKNQYGQAVTSGLYFYSLTADGVTVSRRLMLLQ